MPIPSVTKKQLQDRTILVACSAKKMVELVAGLESMGANVLRFPVVEAQAMEDTHSLDNALASLCKYDWIIFTSAYGVSFFMQRLKELKIPADAQSMPKICAIGPATAAATKEFGYEAALIPKKYVAEGILEVLERYYGGLSNIAGHRILLPRAQEARELLPEALAAAGATIDVVPCYQTVRGELDPDAMRQLREKWPDLLVFTSSAILRNFLDIVGYEDGKRMLLESSVAVIGPVTAKTAESFGKRAEIMPEESTIAALLKAIGEYYSSRQ